MGLPRSSNIRPTIEDGVIKAHASSEHQWHLSAFTLPKASNMRHHDSCQYDLPGIFAPHHRMYLSKSFSRGQIHRTQAALHGISSTPSDEFAHLQARHRIRPRSRPPAKPIKNVPIELETTLMPPTYLGAIRWLPATLRYCRLLHYTVLNSILSPGTGPSSYGFGQSVCEYARYDTHAWRGSLDALPAGN